MSKTILEQVRDELRNCGAVSTEQDFCETWLLKSECYLRTLRFTKSEPSADALAVCASKLGYYADRLRGGDAAHHAYWADKFLKLSHACQAELEKLALLKWQARTGDTQP
ncbi:DUF6626 family protein [Cereibacter changlensis]|uniref:DUF6626 family protein n=1 Tax=Cereibacter changlensis TaxID=402884 RepID=UPI00403342BA